VAAWTLRSFRVTTVKSTDRAAKEYESARRGIAWQTFAVNESALEERPGVFYGVR